MKYYIEKLSLGKVIAWVFVIGFIVIWVSAIANSLQALFPSIFGLKTIVDIAQIVGSLATAFTLVWLIHDKFHERRDSHEKYLVELIIETAKRLPSFKDADNFNSISRFKVDVKKLIELMADLSSSSVSVRIESTFSVVSSEVKRHLLALDFCDLFGELSSSHVKIPKEIFIKTREETKKVLSTAPFRFYVDTEIEPEFINALTVLGLSRFNEAFMHKQVLQELLTAYVDVFKCLDPKLNEKIRNITAPNDHHFSKSKSFQMADILRLYEFPKLAGAHLSVVSELDKKLLEGNLALQDELKAVFSKSA